MSGDVIVMEISRGTVWEDDMLVIEVNWSELWAPICVLPNAAQNMLPIIKSAYMLFNTYILHQRILIAKCAAFRNYRDFATSIPTSPPVNAQLGY